MCWTASFPSPPMSSSGCPSCCLLRASSKPSFTGLPNRTPIPALSSARACEGRITMPAKVMPLVRYFVNNATLSARCDKKNLLWQEEVHQHAAHRCQADQNNSEAPPAHLRGGRGSFKQDHRGDELDRDREAHAEWANDHRKTTRDQLGTPSADDSRPTSLKATSTLLHPGRTNRSTYRRIDIARARNDGPLPPRLVSLRDRC